MEWEMKYIIKLLDTLTKDQIYRQTYAREIKMLFEILEYEWGFEKAQELKEEAEKM